MFTDTSLGLSDWLQMEDIYSNIFVLKCFRYNEMVLKRNMEILKILFNIF